MRSNEFSRVCAGRRVIAALLVTCGLVVGAQTLVAHHAGTMFADEVTEIAGTIKEFQFTNPHVWIQVMVETEPNRLHSYPQKVVSQSIFVVKPSDLLLTSIFD